jgi:glycosyltransferase involved in cell wall biosynthesis
MSRVSVVITCYDQEEYIGDAIGSVVQQSRYDAILEIIVVDDGSTDDSEAVIRNWTSRCEKIQYVYQENQGVSAARNEGIRRSSGDYIAFLDGDDLWCEDRLAPQLELAEKHPDIGLFYGDVYSFEDDPADRTRGYCTRFEYDDEDVLPNLYFHGAPILTPTTLVQTDCFSEVGRFDPSLRQGEDRDMWLRVAAEYPIQHVGEPVALVRHGNESLSTDIDEKAKFMLQGADKMVELYPELDSLRKGRKAKIHSGLARNRLVSGNRTGAIKSALAAISHDPLTPKHHATLGFALLPFGTRQLQWLREWIQGVKRRINRWARP